MAYDGYLALDGHEIINSERFAAYSSSLVPMLSVRNCYPCSGLPNVINRPTSALTRAQILRASAYRTPLLDRPEWFDPEDPDSWGFVGFYMVLFVAAIKGIPAEIFEAARIDGSGRLRTAWSVTLPLIRDNVQTAYIYLGIIAIDAFVYAQALNPNGGPENSTLTMSQRLLVTAFERGQFGMACAMGVVMGIMTMIFAGLVFLVNGVTGGKDRVTLA